MSKLGILNNNYNNNENIEKKGVNEEEDDEDKEVSLVDIYEILNSDIEPSKYKKVENYSIERECQNSSKFNINLSQNENNNNNKSINEKDDKKNENSNEYLLTLPAFEPLTPEIIIQDDENLKESLSPSSPQTPIEESKNNFSKKLDITEVNTQSEVEIWKSPNNDTSNYKSDSTDSITSEVMPMNNNINKLKSEVMCKSDFLSVTETTAMPSIPKSNISPEDIKPLENESPNDFLNRLKLYTPVCEIFKYVSKGTPFYLEILNIIMKGINFQKMAIDKALRTFLSSYALPVEAQEIDRVIKAFADKYHNDNPTLFPTADYPYILAYSLIMLNTDLHNPKVKNKITVKQFISNVEHSEVKYYIPREILEIIYDNIKVSEFTSNNLQPQTSAQLMKKKNGVFQKSLSILTRRNSMSNSSIHLNEKQNFNTSKYENDYDVALDLEYSIMSLANIKIELSSYLCVNQPDLFDLSLMPDEMISSTNSFESFSHQNSPKMYHNSPLATQNYEFSSTSSRLNSDEVIPESDNDNDNSKEEIQVDREEKIDDFQGQKKTKKSIDNSDILQMLYKHKNSEYIEKEKSKLKKNYSQCKKSPLLGRGFLQKVDSKTSLDIDYYKNRDSSTLIDLKGTQDMLLSSTKINNNENDDSYNNNNNNNNDSIIFSNNDCNSNIQVNIDTDIDSLSTTNKYRSTSLTNNDLFKQINTGKNPQLNSLYSLSKSEKNTPVSSKLVIQLKEGKMKKGLYCDKTGKFVWNGKLSTYWVVLCEDRLILFSNWKWFENNNKSQSQKKDQSTIINVPKVSYIIPIINGVCIYSKFEFKGRNIFHLCFDKKDIIFELETKESMIEWMNSINFLSSFVSANLNPLKCNKNIKSCESLNDSLTNLEKELDVVLNEDNSEQEVDNENSNKDKESINKSSCNEGKETIIEKKTESNEKMNKVDSNENNLNDNLNTKVEENNSNNNNKPSYKESDVITSCINYIEFENENLLEYYIKDVIEKYEMKNIEFLKNIQEYKKLYSQYIILSPISKISKQKCNDQLVKIIRQIRKNKILYERYCCYIYFLKNCFEVDVTSNSNIYREVEDLGSYNYIDDSEQTSPIINGDDENINIYNNDNNNNDNETKEDNDVVDNNNTNNNDDTNNSIHDNNKGNIKQSTTDNSIHSNISNYSTSTTSTTTISKTCNNNEDLKSSVRELEDTNDKVRKASNSSSKSDSSKDSSISTSTITKSNIKNNNS